jgi:hypothetical protein
MHCEAAQFVLQSDSLVLPKHWDVAGISMGARTHWKLLMTFAALILKIQYVDPSTPAGLRAAW